MSRNLCDNENEHGNILNFPLINKQKSSEINLLHLNIQCLNNKIDELNFLLCDFKFDIISMCEHWLSENQLKSINLYNYNLVSFFCRETNKHGGVCVFLNDKIKYRTIDVTKFCTELHAEFCAVEIIKISTVIITCYRSPKYGNFQCFLNSMNELLSYISSKYINIIMAGDFNINFLENCVNIKILTDSLNSFGMGLFFNEPTRVTSHSATCIDNIASTNNFPNVIPEIIDFSLSDHFGLVLYITCDGNIKESQSKKMRVFKKEGFVSVRDALNQIDLTDYYKIHDANLLSKFLLNTYTTQIDLHFPVKTLHNNNKSQIHFFNEDLKRMRNILNSLKTISLCTRNQLDVTVFREFQKKYRKEIVTAKKIAHDNLIIHSKNLSKDGWRIINNELNRDCKKPIENCLSAQELNIYFVNTCENIIKMLPYQNQEAMDFLKSVHSPQESFFFISYYERRSQFGYKGT